MTINYFCLEVYYNFFVIVNLANMLLFQPHTKSESLLKYDPTIIRLREKKNVAKIIRTWEKRYLK